MPKRLELEGQTFTYLTALEYIRNGFWLCQCKCGEFREVTGHYLTTGRIKSCGCYKSEALTHRWKAIKALEAEHARTV